MQKLFTITIITPDTLVYEGKIVSLIVPAALGYLGVLANHAPLVASLERGKIIVKEESGQTRSFRAEGKGYLEVLNNNVTMMLEYATPKEQH